MISTIFASPLLNSAYLYCLKQLTPYMEQPDIHALLDWTTETFETAELERMLEL